MRNVILTEKYLNACNIYNKYVYQWKRLACILIKKTIRKSRYLSIPKYSSVFLIGIRSTGQKNGNRGGFQMERNISAVHYLRKSV